MCVGGVDLSLLLTGGRNVSPVWSFFILRLSRGSGRAQVALRLKQRLLRVVGEKGNTTSRYSHSVLDCFVFKFVKRAAMSVVNTLFYSTLTVALYCLVYRYTSTEPKKRVVSMAKDVSSSSLTAFSDPPESCSNRGSIRPRRRPR